MRQEKTLKLRANHIGMLNSIEFVKYRVFLGILDLYYNPVLLLIDSRGIKVLKVMRLSLYFYVKGIDTPQNLY